MQSELRVVDIFTSTQIMSDVLMYNYRNGQFGIFSAVVLQPPMMVISNNLNPTFRVRLAMDINRTD